MASRYGREALAASAASATGRQSARPQLRLVMSTYRGTAVNVEAGSSLHLALAHFQRRDLVHVATEFGVPHARRTRLELVSALEEALRPTVPSPHVHEGLNKLLRRVKPHKGAQPSLPEARPELVAEWHPTLNNALPDEFTAGSKFRAWWRCTRDTRHEWAATIFNRARGGNGCPFCSGHRLRPDASVAARYPKVAKEWHPTKNAPITPRIVAPTSDERFWWRCKRGHEWTSTVFNRTANGAACPYCSGRRATPATSLAANAPEIAALWHPTKNGSLTPDRVKPFSKKAVFWRCAKVAAHVYRARIGNRVAHGTACPICRNRVVVRESSLGAQFPEVAREWDVKKNGDLTPFDVPPKGSCRAWWRCAKGHTWSALVSTRTVLKRGCPRCSQARLRAPLSAVRADIAAEYHPTLNGKRSAKTVRYGSTGLHAFRVRTCGHVFRSTIAFRVSTFPACPTCEPALQSASERVFRTRLMDPPPPCRVREAAERAARRAARERARSSRAHVP